MESSNQVQLGNLWKDWTERERLRVREKRRSTGSTVFFLFLCSSVIVFFGFLLFLTRRFYYTTSDRVLGSLQNSTLRVVWYYYVHLGIFECREEFGNKSCMIQVYR